MKIFRIGNHLISEDIRIVRQMDPEMQMVCESVEKRPRRKDIRELLKEMGRFIYEREKPDKCASCSTPIHQHELFQERKTKGKEV